MKFRFNRKTLLADLLVFGLLCIVVLSMFQNQIWNKLKLAPKPLDTVTMTKPDGTSVTILPESQAEDNSNPEKLLLAQHLAEKLAGNSLLPETSMLHNDDLTSESSTGLMLETLAVELGNSEIYSLIKSFRQNEEESNEAQKQIANITELGNVPAQTLKEVARSNPSIAARASATKSQSSSASVAASATIKRLAEENLELEKKIVVALQKQGFKIDPANVRALCSSPDRNDIIGLARSYRCIQEMTKELELLVLAQPDKNQARKYYATYSVLLLALDKIQTNYINKIEAVHIPCANTIVAAAEKTINEAQTALLSQDALDNPQATAALGLNVKTCKSTRQTALQTISQLERQRNKLLAANKKIKFSILAAKNTYKTLSLQSELAAFIRNCANEMQEVESLSLPEMLVIRFDDGPELTTRKQILN